jgi:hypothetical protein
LHQLRIRWLGAESESRDHVGAEPLPAEVAESASPPRELFSRWPVRLSPICAIEVPDARGIAGEIIDGRSGTVRK